MRAEKVVDIYVNGTKGHNRRPDEETIRTTVIGRFFLYNRKVMLSYCIKTLHATNAHNFTNVKLV